MKVLEMGKKREGGAYSRMCEEMRGGGIDVVQVG
jgi:hypothetical protein